MDARRRQRLLRLSAQINKNPEYAEKIGVSIQSIELEDKKTLPPIVDTDEKEAWVNKL